VRQDPILKFMATAVTFYGMSTFEGPLLSIKSVSGLAHYTDWIIAHVHGGTLGWNGFLIAGMAYYLVPKLWKRELYSLKLANVHFWLGLSGIILYMISMWTAGITQGMMLKEVSGGKLVNPDFVETVQQIIPLFYVRAFAGILYLTGYLFMLFNLFKTMSLGQKVVNEEAQAVNLESVSLQDLLDSPDKPHRILEGLPLVFTVLSLLAVLVGTIIEIVPALSANSYIEISSKVKPYKPLELAGRDIYIREGCYTCHSQMIRPMVSEFLRYGEPSRAEESIYDHPFQWGSKRTGPDLARVGGKYPDSWHYRHMNNPRSINQNSIMPSYSWLLKGETDFSILKKKLAVLKSLGTPYSDEEIANAEKLARIQAAEIAQKLADQGETTGLENKEIVALIAYLQRLGK